MNLNELASVIETLMFIVGEPLDTEDVKKVTGATEMEFWQALDTLVGNSEVVIDRPKGSRHPRFPSLVYPVDYGYLKDTSAMDGSGIDVWLGSDPKRQIDAVICTVDLLKNDSEIKLLIGCTRDEMRRIDAFHNASRYMKGLLIRRDQ